MSGDYTWSATTSPKKSELRGVGSHDDDVFVSGKRGVLIECPVPGQWEGVFTTGATDDGRGVLDVSLTDDGDWGWFAGYSGTFGYYDRANETIVGVGSNGCVLVIDENGRLTRGGEGIGKTFSGPEVLADSTIVTLWRDGVIAGGRRSRNRPYARQLHLGLVAERRRRSRTPPPAAGTVIDVH